MKCRLIAVKRDEVWLARRHGSTTQRRRGEQARKRPSGPATSDTESIDAGMYGLGVRSFANVRQSTSVWARIHKADEIAIYLMCYRTEARCHLPLLLYLPCSIVDPALPRWSLSPGLSHRSVLGRIVPKTVVCATFTRENPHGC
jgi:hypothetical protein